MPRDTRNLELHYECQDWFVLDNSDAITNRSGILRHLLRRLPPALCSQAAISPLRHPPWRTLEESWWLPNQKWPTRPCSAQNIPTRSTTHIQTNRTCSFENKWLFGNWYLFCDWLFPQGFWGNHKTQKYWAEASRTISRADFTKYSKSIVASIR